MNKTHKEFVKDVAVAASLPAQSNKDLNCESDEDRAMYDDGIGKSVFAVKVSNKVNDAPNVKGESDGN